MLFQCTFQDLLGGGVTAYNTLPVFKVYLIKVDGHLCVHETIPIIKNDHTHHSQKVPLPHYYVPSPLLHYPTDLLFITIVQSEFAGILCKWNELFFLSGFAHSS